MRPKGKKIRVHGVLHAADMFSTLVGAKQQPGAQQPGDQAGD